MTVFCKKKKIMRLFCEKKKHYETIFYEREKHYKTLLYKEGMKFAMVYRYSDMNVYQMKMSNCELVKIMHVNIHSFV